jgi:hypothetical protein
VRARFQRRRQINNVIVVAFLFRFEPSDPFFKRGQRTLESPANHPDRLEPFGDIAVR